MLYAAFERAKRGFWMLFMLPFAAIKLLLKSLNTRPHCIGLHKKPPAAAFAFLLLSRIGKVVTIKILLLSKAI
jgi:hypothetical protein